VNWTKTNIDDAIYIYNADIQQYEYYVGGVASSNGSRYIANSQGFYVKANAAAPILIAQETVKTNQTSTFLRTTEPLNVLRLKLSGNDKNDEALIRFVDDATMSFDNKYEAYKRYSPSADNPGLSVLQGNDDLAICALPKGQTNLLIPIKTTIGTYGQYTLSWTINNRLEEEYCMVLEDKKTGAITDMKTFSNYSFELVAGDNNDRFVIHSSHALPTAITHPSCAGDSHGIITVNNRFKENVKVELLNNKNSSLATANFSSENYQFENLAPGTYTLVFATSGVCNTLSQSIEIKGDQLVNADFSVNKETVEMNINETIEVSPEHLGSNISIDFGDGTIINPSKDQNTAQHRYNSEGEYTITVTSSNGNCSDSKNIQVLVFNNEKFAVTQLGSNLQMDFNFEEGTDVAVSITSSAGQNTMNKIYRGLTNGRQNLNIAEMDAGIYYVNFTYNDKVVVKKIVK
jgi:PKD repeat protein